MQYKITKQYVKDTESPLAEFSELTDAELFINAKLFTDESKSVKLIYRLFDNEKLLIEFNKEKLNIPISRAQYADGDVDFPKHFASPFNVRKQSDVSNFIGKFCNIDDAKLFITSKLSANADDNINESFLIFNGKQFIEQIDQSLLDLQQSQSKTPQGKQQKISFRPTPFATSLRLGPPKWIIDEEDDDAGKNE